LALGHNQTFQTELSDEKCVEIKAKFSHLLFVASFITFVTVLTVVVVVSAIFLNCYRDKDNAAHLSKTKELEDLLLEANNLYVKRVKRKKTRDFRDQDLTQNESQDSLNKDLMQQDDYDTPSVSSSESSDADDFIYYSPSMQPNSSYDTKYMPRETTGSDLELSSTLDPDEIELHLKLMLIELNTQNESFENSLVNRLKNHSERLCKNVLDYTQAFLKRIDTG
jgi:hypothetical protein